MYLIERVADIISGKEDLEDLHTMHNFPVFMGCVDGTEDQDIRAEQTWQISKSTGNLQLKKLIPTDILYQAQHSGAVGAIWMNHHREFCRFLQQYHPKAILELGGAHGILSLEYQKRVNDCSWTIIEPNPSPVKGCKATFIKGFFDENFKYENPFDAIVHSHVFEHIYNPNDFIRHLSEIMGEGKQLIFSIPNMQIMLERKYTNCINFEHTVFLTEVYVEYLLAKYGFKLLAKEYFMSDHSIFYAAVRCDALEPTTLPNGLYEKNKKLYLDYIYYHKELVSDLNKKIHATTHPIYLFGAHVFAQYLIEMGLYTEKIICLLDNDENKHGKRLYGTNLRVASPKILKDISDPVVIVKAGVYSQEIMLDIINNINSKVIFLE